MTNVKIVNSIITIAKVGENGEYKLETFSTPSKYTFKSAKEKYCTEKGSKVISISYESVEYSVDTIALAEFLDGQQKLDVKGETK